MNKQAKLLIIAITFLLFAALQVNDPDPLIWISIYSSISTVAITKIWSPKFNTKSTITVLIIMFCLYALVYVPSFIDYLRQPDKIALVGQMKADTPWVEGTRELFGLVISVITLAYLRRK